MEKMIFHKTGLSGRHFGKIKFSRTIENEICILSFCKPVKKWLGKQEIIYFWEQKPAV